MLANCLQQLSLHARAICHQTVDQSLRQPQDESAAHYQPAPTEAEKEAFYLKAHGKK